MAHPKHDGIRELFQCRCGYCGITEIESGGELTVDHFRPIAAGGDDSDDNLIYACARCNGYKHDYYPTPDDVIRGRRVLHPILDEIEAHIRIDAIAGTLDPVTEIGRFHIALLHLNRPALVTHRKEQHIRRLLEENLNLLQTENDHLRETVALRDTMISELRRLIHRPNDE